MLLTYRGAEYNQPEDDLKVSESSLEGKYRGAVTTFRHQEKSRQHSILMRYRGAFYQ